MIFKLKCKETTAVVTARIMEISKHFGAETLYLMEKGQGQKVKPGRHKQLSLI